MKWIKKGLIFDIERPNMANKRFDFAQSPQTLVFEDFVRIYFSTRKKDIGSDKYLSHIDFVEFDRELKNIIGFSSEPVIELGELGSFDEHGIFPINLLRHEGRILAYTCGWSRRISVSVETSTGLAYSYDDGLTFERIGNGPVLTSSLKEPFLVGDSFVKFYDGIFHMWYMFGQRWIEETDKEPPARVYKIAHAISEDGVRWIKEEGKQIISDVLNVDECQALPTVIKIDNKYHMYFCFREASDFRNNPARSYSLGYAWSDDLINWTRDDENVGIYRSSSGWDSEMMCYPHIFNLGDKIFLLYNGNKFGKQGFGLAELEM